MNDDLISRKAFLEYMHKNFAQTSQVVVFCGIISEQPTAFDKERVIEELQEAGQSCNEADDICGVEAIEYAIEIVEKGGIE